MKQIIPEIYVKNCAAALDFYSKIFGGEVKNLQISDNMQRFGDITGKIIHSELHINSKCIIYFIDAINKTHSQNSNITLMLHMDSLKEIQDVYSALKIGANVLMELQPTYVGGHHAILTDKFGTPWALNFSGK